MNPLDFDQRVLDGVEFRRLKRDVDENSQAIVALILMVLLALIAMAWSFDSRLATLESDHATVSSTE